MYGSRNLAAVHFRGNNTLHLYQLLLQINFPDLVNMILEIAPHHLYRIPSHDGHAPFIVLHNQILCKMGCKPLPSVMQGGIVHIFPLFSRLSRIHIITLSLKPWLICAAIFPPLPLPQALLLQSLSYRPQGLQSPLHYPRTAPSLHRGGGTAFSVSL